MDDSLKKRTISIDDLVDEAASSYLPPKPEGTKIDPEVIGKYHLPVLNINHTREWETKPVSERKLWTDAVAMETCLGNCCGVKGLKGACCHLDPVNLEHILGPVDERWIADTIKWFRARGQSCTRHDLVVDFEEGKVLGETLFKDAPNNIIFQQEKAYPFLRFQVLGPRYACKFMNPDTYKCNIYQVRPDMCRNYLCSYVSSSFLVKTKSKPNTWQRVL